MIFFLEKYVKFLHYDFVRSILKKFKQSALLYCNNMSYDIIHNQV